MSTLRVDTIQNAAGTDSPISVPGTAKAWVNFNGTGTVAIRASYNVSSITDNGVGSYIVNFTTAMPDTNYIYAGGDESWGIIQGVGVKTTTQSQHNCTNGAGAAGDRSIVCLSFFR